MRSPPVLPMTGEVAPARLRGSVHLTETQKQLRRNETPAEHILWKALKARQVNGIKFRRQHGIGPYIVDFYCDRYRLIIELDGNIHERPEIKEYDHDRQQFLIENDYKVIRFKNDDIFDRLDIVIAEIKRNTPPVTEG